MAATNWPDDADGDVLRRLEEDGFDFAKPWLIDFNVDFASWPPMAEAVAVLKHRYPNAAVREPDGDHPGYIQFRVQAVVSYDLVLKLQQGRMAR